jgi:hypothetical protein
MRDRQDTCPLAVWRSRSCGTREWLFFQPFRRQSETAKAVFVVAVSLGGRGGLAVSRSGTDRCSSELAEQRARGAAEFNWQACGGVAELPCCSRNAGCSFSKNK